MKTCNICVILSLTFITSFIFPCLAEEDTNPPRLLSVHIPAQVRQGDTFQVEVEASDDLSGMHSVFIYVRRANGEPYRSAVGPAKYDDIRKRFIEQYTINQYDMKGTWSVVMVKLQDKAGNTVRLRSPDDFKAECTVLEK